MCVCVCVCVWKGGVDGGAGDSYFLSKQAKTEITVSVSPSMLLGHTHPCPSLCLSLILISHQSVLKFILFFCGRCQFTSRTTHSSLTKYTNPSLAHLGWILISTSCKPTRAGRVPQRHTLPPSGRRFTRRLGRHRAFGRGTRAEPPALAPSAGVMALSLFGNIFPRLFLSKFIPSFKVQRKRHDFFFLIFQGRGPHSSTSLSVGSAVSLEGLESHIA